MKMNHKRASKTSSQSQPSPCLWVKASEASHLSNSPAGATSDGVVVGGMVGNDIEISREICGGEAGASTGATSLATDKGAGTVAEVGAADSSVDLWDTITHEERDGSACIQTTRRSEGDGDGRKKRIGTPEKLRKLQIALYRKAKAEPQWRFYSLYGEICREEVLMEAVRQVVANQGAPGVDGMQPMDIAKKPGGTIQWVKELSEELRAKKYRTAAIKRAWIPKGDGKKRPLGIPTVKDRVVQTALMLVLMPIYEVDFHEHSYAYRPKRRAAQAMEAIKKELWKGKTEIVDADLSAYFDNIPHRALMRQLVKRIADGSVLALIKQWLKAPVVEQGKDGKRRMHGNRCGTPQGGVISPLLANIYLSDLDHGVNDGTAQKAAMVRYADDFVILCAPGQSGAMRERLENWLQRRELKLNETKTRVLDGRKEGFEFLGWEVTPRQTKGGRSYYHMEPSQKSRSRLMDRVREVLNKKTQWKASGEVIDEINSVMQGWSGYFSYGHGKTVFNRMHDLISERLRTWLWKKHSKSEAKYKHYTRHRLRKQYGLYPMNMTTPTATV